MDADGASQRYRLVGPDEFDEATEYISIDSPMARALLKKQTGDEIRLSRDQGERVFRVVDISYDEPTDSRNQSV